VSDVRFARSGDVDVAFRIVGEGPVDLVYARCGAMMVSWRSRFDPSSRRPAGIGGDWAWVSTPLHCG